MPRTGRTSRLLAACVALAVVALVLVVGGDAPPAAAIDGLTVTSSTTYTVDPVAGVVHTRTELGFVNTTVDTERDGAIERRYFEAFSFPVPVGAGPPAAVTADGAPLATETDPIEGNTNFVRGTVRFPAPLYSGEQLDVVVTYDIAGLPPRSDDPSRVNAAYAAFTAYAVGDPGLASIAVVVPAEYDVSTVGSEAQETTENGATVYRADAIARPDEYALFVSARNDAALVTTPATEPGGARFEVQAWPGDDAWQQFIAQQIADGVPRLAEAIGVPWPLTDEVRVREASTPYLYGYAGWFSAADDQIEVGEDLDPLVVLHELSHAWFNTRWFDDRWVSEGFAQTYAAALVAASGGSPPAPVAPAADDPARIALLDWGQPDVERNGGAVETYGYAASYAVVRQIVDRIGLDGMRRVLAAVDARTIAYVGNGPAEADSTATTDWRRLLDLVDELGADATSGVPWSAQSLFEQYVVTPDLAPQLERRSGARTKYAALEARGGEWSPPLAVRRAMADWDFDQADTAIAAAIEVLDARDALTVAARALGVEVGDDDRDRFESAPDAAALDAVSASLRDRLDTVGLVGRALDETADDPDLLSRVGRWGSDPAGDAAAARAALAAGDDATARAAAERALAAVDDERSRGTQRAAGAAVVLVVLVLAATGARRARRRRSGSATQAADT